MSMTSFGKLSDIVPTTEMNLTFLWKLGLPYSLGKRVEITMIFPFMHILLILNLQAQFQLCGLFVLQRRNMNCAILLLIT